MTLIRIGEIEISVGNRKRGDVGAYVGRPTALGNPFHVMDSGRNKAIAQYREWLRGKVDAHDPVVCDALERLRIRAVRDKKLMLVCWCAPMPCHANVVADELARVIAAGGTFAEVQDGGRETREPGRA